MGSELVIQATQQSLAHRLWRYTRSWASLFPDGYATEAIEVGPYTDKLGPSLVHLKGSQLSPAEWNKWITEGPAATNVMRVYWLGTSPSDAASLEDLLQQLLAAGPPADGGSLRLQCFPRSLETWLGDRLPLSFDLRPVNPSWVLHVVTFGQPLPVQGGGSSQQQQPPQQQQQEEGCSGETLPPPQQQHFLYSWQPAEDLYNHPSLRTKRVPDQLSKAAGKLAEALAVAGVQLTQGIAVDLGAAPGGWTQVLAQQAQRVIAVDPAELDPRLLALPNVTHFACKAEDAVDQIHELAGEKGIDLLVSDVNRHPAQLASLVRPLLPLLRPGGALLLTLKYRGRSKDKEAAWKQKLAAELGEGLFDRAELVWLLANTQHEQTYIAWKAAA